ncbi:hypothetical protein TrVFT333_003698 [Trichoderma virens FT-333]|nr:hypothetical protein TrVFT333_003698 [Trichoderma virens FT-333]
MPNASTQHSAPTQQKSKMETLDREPSQYHHFVPQFLLRNFASTSAAPKNGSKTSTRHRAGKKARQRDPIVNRLDLSSEAPKVVEMQVKNILGKIDMYRDTNKPYQQQQHIEKMFSKVESKVSAIFRNITKSFNERQSGIWLTRSDRNDIRKFLFLMKYRGSTFYRRYNHDTAAGYEANDREKMLEYMQEKGFERPIDVWLDNIKTIIELDMDDELKWISELPQRMYPDDAMWVIMHCQSMFMAICTPSKTQDEFILTDNCYHIFEGPNQLTLDLETGKSKEVAWTNLHEFAPISPKLMIVLRSFLLPSPEDATNPKLRAQKAEQWHLAVEKFHGSDIKSTLADLPISKASNNYTHYKDGTPWLNEDEDGSLRPHHKFFFEFFPIDTHHVNEIHCVFLDNASSCTSVVFRSKESFLQTLEWYLTRPNWSGKRVTCLPDDLQRLCLRKLAAVLKQMGSDKEPVWEEIDVPWLKYDAMQQVDRVGIFDMFPELLDSIPDDNPTEYMQIYNILGGSKQTIAKDMQQTRLMMKLRIKIDVWSHGIDESLRERNRTLLMDAYTRLPPHRFWIYTKHWRYTILCGPGGPSNEEQIQSQDFSDDGPENAIARARHIIKPSRLNVLMKIAVENDIRLKKTPNYQLSWRITMDQKGAQNRRMIRALAFKSHIQDCGRISFMFYRDCYNSDMAQESKKSKVLQQDAETRCCKNSLQEGGNSFVILFSQKVR